MKRALPPLILLSLIILSFSFGCVPVSSMGTEGGPCFSGDKCLEGLECISGTCVKSVPDGGDAGEDSGHDAGDGSYDASDGGADAGTDGGFDAGWDAGFSEYSMKTSSFVAGAGACTCNDYNLSFVLEWGSSTVSSNDEYFLQGTVFLR